MTPVATLRLAADILRYRPPAGLAPIAGGLAAMCDREADRVEAMERAREREIERRRSDGRDHAWLDLYAPAPDPHLYAIARHVTGEP